MQNKLQSAYQKTMAAGFIALFWLWMAGAGVGILTANDPVVLQTVVAIGVIQMLGLILLYLVSLAWDLAGAIYQRIRPRLGALGAANAQTD